MIISPLRATREIMAHNVFLVYSLLHIVHHFTVTVNNIEVTVDTHIQMYRRVYNNNNKGPISWDISITKSLFL